MNSDLFFERMRILLQTVLFGGILTLWLPEMPTVVFFDTAVFAMGVLWVVAVALRPFPIRGSWAMIPLATAVLWPLLQLAFHETVYCWNTINAFWRWTVNFLCFFLSCQIATDPRRLLRFLKTTLYFAFGLSMLSTLQMFTAGGKIFWIFPSGYADYVLGPFVYRNQYAAFIELTLPIALCFAMFSKKDRSIYSGIAAVMITSVIACASRAGMILVSAGVVIVPLIAGVTHMTDRRRAGAVLASTATLTAISGMVVGYGAVWERFFSADPYFLRREVTAAGLRMFRDRPVMGFGLGTWAQSYPAYAIFDPGAVINQAHNDWLQWAVEGGLPFVAFILCASGLLVRPAVRSLWGMGVLCVLIHCLVDYPLQQRPAFAAFFFAMAGVVCGDIQRELPAAPSYSAST